MKSTSLLINVSVADKRSGVFMLWMKEVAVDVRGKVNQLTIDKAFREQHAELIKSKNFASHCFAYIVRWSVKLCTTPEEVQESLDTFELRRKECPLL